MVIIFCRGSAHSGRAYQRTRYSACPSMLYSRREQAGGDNQAITQRWNAVHIARKPQMIMMVAFAHVLYSGRGSGKDRAE